MLKQYFSTYFRTHGRSFPWRKPTTSPFRLLLAELLLRQTDAPKVANIWSELTYLAPDPETLLTLDKDKIRRIVQPLGLGNQRVHALSECCGALISKHHGRMPRSPYKLLDLPHVGLYTAAAIACFAFDRRNPVVDENVLRVLGRLTGQDFARDNRRSIEVWQLAWAILPQRDSRQHNLGILDFAAQICTAHSPKCGECAISSTCNYYLQNTAQ